VISVLTPTIPERSEMLRECEASVQCQTYDFFLHEIEVDTEREGCAAVMNRLAEKASGEWLLPLADDDLLLPGCLATLLAHSEDADVVYSPPLVWGLTDPWWFFQTPPAIPAVALIRAELWQEIGGYDESLTREEDRAMWTKALELGARFVRASDAPTWVYRIHSGNKSFHDGVAS
jgi:glycosyltransferase involved in cell wall biosynthesis